MIFTPFTILKSFWPFFVLFIFIIIVKVFFEDFLPILNKRRKFNKQEKWLSGREMVVWVQKLKPKDFENYIAHLFVKLGYSVEVTGGAYDGGIDLIADKSGVKYYIQCKKFITQQVSVGAIRDFSGSMADKAASGKCYFSTTNKFTLDAEKFAENKPIELIDGLRLAEYINMAKMTNSDLRPSAERLCPLCGGKIVKKIGKFGEFLGCSNYPKCKFTENIHK